MPGHADLELSYWCPWTPVCLLLSWFVGFLSRPCTYVIVSSRVSCHSWKDPWAYLGLVSLLHLVWDCQWTSRLSPPCPHASSGCTPTALPCLLSTSGSSCYGLMSPSWINCPLDALWYRHVRLWVALENHRPQISIVCHHLALISTKVQHEYCYVITPAIEIPQHLWEFCVCVWWPSQQKSFFLVFRWNSTFLNLCPFLSSCLWASLRKVWHKWSLQQAELPRAWRVFVSISKD